MRESRKNLKLKARRAMMGKYPVAAGVCALWVVIGLVFLVMWQICLWLCGILAASMRDVDHGFRVMVTAGAVSLAVFFLAELLMIPGILRLYLNICQGRRARVWDMFWGFHCHGWKFFGISLLFLLGGMVLLTPGVVLVTASSITSDWQFAKVYLPRYALLLLAAGLYTGLTYGQFYVILADDPEKSLLEAFEESREMMRGNRMRFLVLCLSFAGWLPVVYITCGVALVWLIPYILCTMLFFYLNLREVQYQE